MTFRITAMTPQAQWRNFLLQHEDVEQVYECLRTIVDQGDTLVTVTMIDAQGYLPLPLASLEKGVFCNPIEELRRQWEPLLAKPQQGYAATDEFTQRRVELRLARIDLVRQTLSRIHELIDAVPLPLRDNSEQTSLLRHYNRLLDRYSRMLVKLELNSPLQELASGVA